MQKEGIEKAIDFTKYLLTLAGAALAFFVTQIDRLVALSYTWKGIVTLGAISFTFSIVAGLLVLMRASTMLAEEHYDLRDDSLRIPGLLNVISIGLGSLCFSAYFLSALWSKGSS